MNSKNNRDDLFDLIRSLTKGEKRTFKIFSDRHKMVKGNRSVRLFDVIERQKKYNPKTIKRQFQTKQLHVTKYYLYNLILKSIEQHFNHGSGNLSGKLKQAIFLYQKGLHSQCHKILDKIILESKQQEHLEILLEAIALKIKLTQAEPYLSFRQNKLLLLIKSEREILTYLKERNQCKELERRIIHYSHQYRFIRNSRALQMQNRILKNPLLANPEKGKTTYSKWLLYILRGVLFMTTTKFTQARRELLKARQIIDNNILFKHSHPETVAVTICNISNIYCLLHEYDKLPSELAQFKQLILQHPHNYFLKSLLFREYHSEMIVYLNTGNYQKALKCKGEIEKEMISNATFIKDIDKLAFYFNASCAYLLGNRYREALLWNNQLLSFSKAEDISYYIYSAARMLQLIILFEKREFASLEYRVKSFYRYMSSRSELYGFEKIIIKFIQDFFRYVNIFDNKQVNHAFSNLKKNIETECLDARNSIHLDYFDFVGWIDSKIENRPFAEVVREKAGK